MRRSRRKKPESDIRRDLCALICAAFLGCSGTSHKTRQPDGIANAPRQHPIVGTWEPTNLGYGIFGSTLIFSADGDFAMVTAMMLGGTYAITGNVLTLKFPAAGDAFVEPQTITFDGDAIKLTGRTTSRRLVPLGRAQHGTIVGRWFATHSNGAVDYEEYSSDGRVRLRMPMRVARGRYQVTGDTTLRFRLTSPATPEQSGTFRIRGDTLSTGSNSRVDVYVRARPLIPASVEQPKVTIK